MSVPDHYRGAQHDLVVRGSGFLSIVGAVAVLVVIPFYPPTAQIGTAGLVLVLVGMAVSLTQGARALTLRRQPSDFELAASSFIGVAQIAILQWLAGGGDAPYLQLLLLPTFGAASGQPRRRCILVLVAAWAAALSPLLYSSIAVPATITEMAVLSFVTMMMSVVLESTRTHRARLKDASEYANELAHVDQLTGMPNRRAFDETLTHGISRARLESTPMSLLLCDVNAFKEINDTLGHQAGDEVLRAIAQALTDTVRKPDAAFRWAGDEFAVILSDSDEDTAVRVALRLREAVTAHCTQATGRAVTIGTGVAQLGDDMTAQELLATADAALFAQKRPSGRMRRAA
jgi:diguanylate cyclase (GGDEF)-like protein